MRMDPASGKWQRAYDPYVEPEAEPEPIGQQTIDEQQQATHSFKFPDMSNMQGALSKLPLSFGRKDAAGKKSG